MSKDLNVQVPNLSESSDSGTSENEQDMAPRKRQRSTFDQGSASSENEQHDMAPRKRQRSMYDQSGASTENEEEDMVPRKRQRSKHDQGGASSKNEQGIASRKRQRSMFNLCGASSDNQNRESTDLSTPDDDFDRRSSGDYGPTINAWSANPVDMLVKHAKPSGYVDSKAQKMMENMGYRAGRGLGKNFQGRVDPVELSTQRGRRGLGHCIKGFEPANLVWDSTLEVVSVEEEVLWLAEPNHTPLASKTLESWVTEGPKKHSLEGETSFCEPHVLENVLQSKTMFDSLETDEFTKARTRSNPFETIRKGLFQNRAAMKMANMDKVFDFMFTSPVDELGAPMVTEPPGLLYFADVCAGPGGFSEYVLWRKGWQAKGFGFTLKGDNDFQLSNFYAGPCESFDTHYGVNGINGDGNVFNPENIIAFSNYVLDQTGGAGVHFMMADGGFSVEGQENIQEILSKQLYLCQFLVSLFIVRTDGHFVCKLFDVFTPFSVGLVYLLYKSFVKISIHKPNTSRPANSERYIICKWKRPDTEAIRDYMYRINRLIWKMGQVSDNDVLEVVPMSVLSSDEEFYNYIVEANNFLGERQVINLVKIIAFCRDVNLNESRQAELRKQCLKYWDVPDKARAVPIAKSADTKCDDILRAAHFALSVLTSPEIEVPRDGLEHVFKSVHDWHCVVTCTSREQRNCTFYMGVGRSNVYKLTATGWLKVNEPLELSPDTLLYGELVQEKSGEGRSQQSVTALHIIDAVCLGGLDISSKPLAERHSICRKYSHAITKASHTNLMQIRVKELFEIENIDYIFQRLDRRVTKGAGLNKRLIFNMQGKDDKYFYPGGVLFFRNTKEPWHIHLSKTTQRTYYYNSLTKQSTYELNDKLLAPFSNCFQSRHVWWWEPGVKVHDEHQDEHPEKIHRDQIIRFIHNKLTSS